MLGRGLRAAGTALALVAACVPATARAGDYHQVICADPETGQAVGGGLPEGMSFHTTNASFSGAGQPAGACDGENHRGLAVVAQTTGPWADGDVASLHYSTPAGLVLEQGVIYRYRRADTRFGNRLGSYQHGGLPLVDGAGSPTNHQQSCNWAAPACFTNPEHSGVDPTTGGWNQAANRVEVVHSAGRWTYSFVCESQDQPTCTPGWTPAHYLYVYGGRMRLREDDAPAVVGTPAGGLRDDAVLSGVESLTYSADDGPGAGLYRVFVEVDGERAVEQVVASNGGRCRDVNPANANPYEYAHQRPCVRSVEDATVSLDTTRLAEGRHVIAVGLEDAARNATRLVAARTVTVDNVPPPQVVAGGEPSISVDGGRAVAGARARATRGTWTGEGNSYAYRWQRCDADGAGCADVAAAEDETYAISSADVGRRLRVRVTASNDEGATDAFSAPTEVVEEPPADIDPEPRDEAPTPAAPSAPADERGAPNGRGASDRATLSAGAGERGDATRVVLRFGAATDLSGRLVADDGSAIAGATLEVVSLPRRPGAAAVPVGTTTTDGDGRYRWRVPPGASRTVRVGYRARARDAGYATSAAVDVLVRSAARLRVVPRSLRNGQAVRFAGQLLGERPGRRVAVVLEARVGRRWHPFARVRADARGRFAARYRFRATTRTRTYAFRAVLPRDADWGYEAGRSNGVRVRVRAR